MAFELIITRSAESDLEGILAYLTAELHNPAAAARLLDRVEECYDALEENPRIYPTCTQPLLRPGGYRKAVLGAYLMIYHVDLSVSRVYVDRFFHELQDYADKL